MRGRLDPGLEHGDATTGVVAETITTWTGFETSTRRFGTASTDAA